MSLVEQIIEENTPIPTGTKATGSDGQTYTWAGAQWISDSTGRIATSAIGQELTAKHAPAVPAEPPAVPAEPVAPTPELPSTQASSPHSMPAQGGRKLGVVGKIGNFAKNMKGWSDRFAQAAKSGVAGVMDPNAKLGKLDPEKIAAAEHVKNIEYALINAGKINSIADVATIPNTGNQLADILSNYQKEPARWKDQFSWAIAQLQRSYGVSISLQGPQGGAVTAGGAGQRTGERTNARDVWDQKVTRVYPPQATAGVTSPGEYDYQAAFASNQSGLANWNALQTKYYAEPQTYQPYMAQFISQLEVQKTQQNQNP